MSTGAGHEALPPSGYVSVYSNAEKDAIDFSRKILEKLINFAGGGVDAIELHQSTIKWSLPGVEQAVLDVPELLGEVHIVPVRVFEALHLVPEGVHL